MTFGSMMNLITIENRRVNMQVLEIYNLRHAILTGEQAEALSFCVPKHGWQ